MQPQIIPWGRVSRYIYKQDTLLVDLRDREEYELGHITGAWNIPYEELEEHLDQMSNYERVIFYCTHGNHSLAAARLLAKRGQPAYSLAGGYVNRERS
jgi:rhodanese-related sulfurtransferase